MNAIVCLATEIVCLLNEINRLLTLKGEWCLIQVMRLLPIILIFVFSLSAPNLGWAKSKKKTERLPPPFSTVYIVPDQPEPEVIVEPEVETPDCKQKKKSKILKEICANIKKAKKEEKKLNKLAKSNDEESEEDEDNDEEITVEAIEVKEVKQSHKKSKVAHLQKDMGEPMVRIKIGRQTMTLPMETYLAGVIGNEMNSRWPVEALKAQAVAARSYALYGMLKAQQNGRSFDLHTTQADQVFRVRESKNTYLLQIVDSTRGEVLTKKGKIVQAFYSSTCGGKTRSAVDAGLSKDSPLTKGCTDRYCEISPFRGWYVALTLKEVEKKLKSAGYPINNAKSIKVKSRDKAGYALTIMVKDDDGYKYIPAWKFRSAIGYMRIKSVLFSIVNEDENVHIHGNGFGHGVGLCQFGAKSMAEQKKNYKQILKKFYPKTTLTKWY